MRVTKIAGDFHYIGERPCRVYCNEVEIEGWTVADDFRRVVETPGKVHHGAVRIDLAPEVEQTGLEKCRAVFDFKLPDDCRLNLPQEERAALAEGCTASMPICDDKPAKVKHIPARKRKASK